MSGLRKVLNTSMMDIMYYTSPFYRYEVQNDKSTYFATGAMPLASHYIPHMSLEAGGKN